MATSTPPGAHARTDDEQRRTPRVPQQRRSSRPPGAPRAARAARVGPLSRLARVLVTRPRRVMLAIFVLTVLGGVFGSSVVALMTATVGDPHSESQQAIDRIVAVSGRGATPDDIVLLVRVPQAWPADAARSMVSDVAERLGDVRGVATVVAPQTGSAAAQRASTGLVARNGDTVLVTAGLTSSADAETVAGVVDKQLGGDDVLVGGTAAVDRDIDARIAKDLSRAEILAFPILFLLAIWIFRGVVAALLPLVVGGISIALTLGLMRLVATQVTLSQYVLNLAIGLGLGLAIDYCLFVVSRYREEVQQVGYGREAVVRTVLTAGRTVLFSATTVMLALATLMIFPQEFLYSMGIGGVLVTAMAALVSVTLVPAALVLLGPRVDALALPAWRRAREQESSDVAAGRWYSLARFVMRRARVLFPVGLLVALLLAAPALQTTFGDVDQTSLPATSEPRVVADRVARSFPGGNTTSLLMAVTAADQDAEVVRSFADRAADAAGGRATLAASPTYAGDRTWLVRVNVTGSPFGARATGAVDRVRTLAAGPGQPATLVGGQAASFVDLESSIGQRLPWALLIVAIAVLLVMFLLTASVVLSVKTLLLNVLNVAMTFGVLVWVFQFGHLEGLLDFTSTGRIDLTQPVLVAIIAFGLSTDYGVFLFARVMEGHRAGLSDDEAVAQGVGRSGRIISSAALLLCIAIGAFSTSSILFIKQLGLGAAVAVFLDATLVRAVLVPSAMRLMGGANWWAPARLKRLAERWDPHTGPAGGEVPHAVREQPVPATLVPPPVPVHIRPAVGPADRHRVPVAPVAPAVVAVAATPTGTGRHRAGGAARRTGGAHAARVPTDAGTHR